MENQNACILVVTHKEFDDSFLIDGYKVIKVGNGTENVNANDKGWISDNTGVNIADKNPYYCELTALYWAWKNLDKSVEYVGLSHYRRFFCKYKDMSSSIGKNLLTISEIKRYLKKYKVILPYESIKSKGMFIPNMESPLIEQDINMGIVDKIIAQKYPKMLTVWHKYIYSNKMIWKNMFVTTREVFDEYCAWMFDVLSEYDKEMLQLDKVKMDRIDGFLGEYLTATFFVSRFFKNEIKHIEVRGTNEFSNGSFIKELLRRNALFRTIIRKFMMKFSKNNI